MHLNNHCDLATPIHCSIYRNFNISKSRYRLHINCGDKYVHTYLSIVIVIKLLMQYHTVIFCDHINVLILNSFLFIGANYKTSHLIIQHIINY